jgi:hypothetical protein
MISWADYHDHVGPGPAKCFKSTLFQSKRLLLGLNCLEPGQEQRGKAESGKMKVEIAPRSSQHTSRSFSFPRLVGIAPVPGK